MMHILSVIQKCIILGIFLLVVFKQIFVSEMKQISGNPQQNWYMTFVNNIQWQNNILNLMKLLTTWYILLQLAYNYFL